MRKSFGKNVWYAHQRLESPLQPAHAESRNSHHYKASIIVDVHQVVRDMTGVVLEDNIVGHLFTFACGLIMRMEVCEIAQPINGDKSKPIT